MSNKRSKSENSPQKRKSFTEICDAAVADDSKFGPQDIKLYDMFQDVKLSDYKFEFPLENKVLYASKMVLASHCKYYKDLFAKEEKTTGEIIYTFCKPYLIALSILHRFNTSLSPTEAYSSYKLFVQWDCDTGMKISGKYSGINAEMMTLYPDLYRQNLNTAVGLTGSVAICPVGRYCVDCVLINVKKLIPAYHQKEFNEEIDAWESSVAKF